MSTWSSSIGDAGETNEDRYTESKGRFGTVTTRFSLAELAEMLHVTVDAVRAAVDELSGNGELTAESFAYAERNWRIAPSDTKRIQEWIASKVASGELIIEKPQRHVLRKRVVPGAEEI
jgi:hypothetical protein